jgi:hypothetical protein
LKTPAVGFHVGSRPEARSDHPGLSIMANSLLTLGSFSFEGLESPEKIDLKTKQRLVVHHLGSGSTTIDYLGNDFETVSFRGIFSGPNASRRVRSIDFLRVLGKPLPLSWNANTLSVIISKFELDYSSDRWIPYRLSCYVIHSVSIEMPDPTDAMSSPPATQVGDILALLINTGANPSSNQTGALLTLTGQNFDTPPLDACGQAQDLIDSIDRQLAVLTAASRNDVAIDQRDPTGGTAPMADLVTNYGHQSALILGRNRVASAMTNAEDMDQY